MLEGLDSVDWSTLTHAYGEADNVPVLIRELASPFPEFWKQALDDLRGCIMHQGTVYEATVFVVPFFIELLEYDSVQCQDELLEDLAYMGFIGEGREGDSAFDVFLTRLYDAVALGLRMYMKLLEEGQHRVRMCALYTLDALRKQTPEIISWMYAHFLQETDPQVKTGFLIYLSSRIEYLPEGEQLFSNLLNTEEEHLLVRALAALKQVQHCKEQTPRETIHLLLDMLVNPGSLEEMYAALPWRLYNLVSTISDFLLFLGYDVADLVIPALLERLRYLDQCYRLRAASHTNGDLWYKLIKQDYATSHIMRTLFHFAFQEKRLQRNAVPFLLTTTQRAVLTAILTSDVAGDFPEEITKCLDEFGLPYRWKLQILLQFNKNKR